MKNNKLIDATIKALTESAPRKRTTNKKIEGKKVEAILKEENKFEYECPQCGAELNESDLYSVDIIDLDMEEECLNNPVECAECGYREDKSKFKKEEKLIEAINEGRVRLAVSKINDLWIIGTVTIRDVEYKVYAKVYKDGSEYGIDGGPVSKLSIQRPLKNHNKLIVNYDRGWDIKPATKLQNDVMEFIISAVIDFRNDNPYEVDEVEDTENDNVEDITEEVKVESIDDKSEEDAIQNTYWNDNGKYQEEVNLLNNLIPATGKEPAIKGIIQDSLAKQFIELAQKYYRWFNDGDIPFRKLSDGSMVYPSVITREKAKYSNPKPMSNQVSRELENRVNALIDKINKVNPDWKEKLQNALNNDEKVEESKKAEAYEPLPDKVQNEIYELIYCGMKENQSIKENIKYTFLEVKEEYPELADRLDDVKFYIETKAEEVYGNNEELEESKLVEEDEDIVEKYREKLELASDEEYEDVVIEIEEKIEELADQVAYEEKRLDVCGYGKSDLYYIDELYAQIEQLRDLI